MRADLGDPAVEGRRLLPVDHLKAKAAGKMDRRSSDGMKTRKDAEQLSLAACCSILPRAQLTASTG